MLKIPFKCLEQIFKEVKTNYQFPRDITITKRSLKKVDH